MTHEMWAAVYGATYVAERAKGSNPREAALHAAKEANLAREAHFQLEREAHEDIARDA